MINYLKSEHYRMLRKKSLHLTTLVCFALLAGAAAGLVFFEKTDITFPYATTSFFYSNILGNAAFIIIVSFLFNFSLTGRDTTVLKNAVTYGVQRTTIYWSKLILTLGYFTIMSIIGIALTIYLGETMLTTDSESVGDFLTALVNMAPLMLSAFLFIHSLKMMKFGDIYVFVVLLFIYGFGGYFLRIGAQKMEVFRTFYAYAPDTLLGKNLMDFMDHTVQFSSEYWVTGGLLSAIALVIGITKFSKQTID